MNSTYVRFVQINPSSDNHPVFTYINQTFNKQATYKEGELVYMGRVIVNANSSYVSIDLEDLSRMGITIKTIELENDGILEFKS